MGFPPGKVPIEVLRKIVFRNLGTTKNDVILGPAVGEDAAIVKVGKEVLAVAMDPITGAEQRLGWLAVNISANDVATCGVQPRWFNSCILLPEGSKEELVERICTQMNKAARQLNIAIIGGHCEITPNLEHPIVTGCTAGIAKNGKYVTTRGAKIGDKIIMTKGIGIEGTAILASDRRKELLKVFDRAFVEKAAGFFMETSVVKDALVAFKVGGVSAMHDPTEGGLAGGLHEIGNAAKVGFRIHEEKILISTETRKICAYFGIDPYQLISSGALLIVAEAEKTEEIVGKLVKNGVPASVIGDVTNPSLGRKIVTRTGEQSELVTPASDHLWIALGRHSAKR